METKDGCLPACLLIITCCAVFLFFGSLAVQREQRLEVEKLEAKVLALKLELHKCDPGNPLLLPEEGGESVKNLSHIGFVRGPHLALAIQAREHLLSQTAPGHRVGD